MKSATDNYLQDYLIFVYGIFLVSIKSYCVYRSMVRVTGQKDFS